MRRFFCAIRTVPACTPSPVHLSLCPNTLRWSSQDRKAARQKRRNANNAPQKKSAWQVKAETSARCSIRQLMHVHFLQQVEPKEELKEQLAAAHEELTGLRLRRLEAQGVTPSENAEGPLEQSASMPHASGISSCINQPNLSNSNTILPRLSNCSYFSRSKRGKDRTKRSRRVRTLGLVKDEKGNIKDLRKTATTEENTAKK